MISKEQVNDINRIKESLKPDCKECFGLCCTALYFSKSEGFPNNKDAGKPCINLRDDFKCSVHKSLRNKGLKGCIAYECFGAGQKISKYTYKGQSWRENPDNSKEMFDLFLIMFQLHEMLWYLTEAFRMSSDSDMQEKIKMIIDETVKITESEPKNIFNIDITAHKKRVNELLLKTSLQIRKKASMGKKGSLKNRKSIAGRLDFIGADCRKLNLVGEDLSGAFFIAANAANVNFNGADLLGADFRDADLSGADLRNSLFLTQMQINSAKGDRKTLLPISLVYPEHWKK
ncbi:MAG: pentapeptide repeat-containing protein [Clostridium sp.]|nr:pentapeptide repeat-containing protein [Clostridium sp.]